MKAIAEYFRDLAADDRYFGAEPPTPDAEMLARIAEREIERRVQARVDHGAIVLSAGAPAPAAEPAPVEQPAQAAPVEDAEPVAVVEAENVQEEIAAPAAEIDTAALNVVEPALEEYAPEIELEETSEESVEETVEAIEDVSEFDDADNTINEVVDTVLDDAPAMGEADQAEEAVAEEALDEAEETAETVKELVEDVIEKEAPAQQVLDAELIEDVIIEADEDVQSMLEEETEIAEAKDSFFDDIYEDIDSDADLAEWEDEDDAIDPEYEENSIAAKLERIRAVVSRVETDPEDDFSEDEHAEAMDKTASPLNETVERIEAALQADTKQDEAPEARDTDEPDTSLVDDKKGAAPQVADMSQPLRARVVRMKKADFEQAVASGLLEAEEDTDNEDDALEAARGSSLTAQDEAELLAELAEVEAELNRSDAADMQAVSEADIFEEPETDAPENLFEEDAPTEVAETTEETPEEEPAVKAPNTEQDDAAFLLTDAVSTPAREPAALDKTDDLSRLMAKAQSEMDEPEGNRRRRAIAHLRAAVKATKAEQASGKTSGKRDATEAYRDDLASVVRAVPGGDTPEPAKNARPKPAPLKLVAEQRIDATEQESNAPAPQEATKDTPRVPVRPRRVSADRKDREEIARAAAPVGNPSAIMGGFHDYAHSVGATRLPEVLEAAAAYLTFVEGHDRFSRPMLMRMARDANEEEFSREIGLRSFGQLLREQKIEKIAGGRFTASPNINFKPDDRAAG
nr:hypothetical protein [Shimia abyssi]